MPKTIDRIQVMLTIVFVIDVFILVLSIVLTRSLRVANNAGYAGMLIVGALFLYTGYKQLSSLREKEGGDKVVWYKQPWILCGWVIYILLILFFVSSI